MAYALAHPDRVMALVLTAVTSGSREEIDWITEGVAAIFPEAWQRFADAASPAVRARAAEAWEEWESTHVSLDPNWIPGLLFEDARERENFATLVTHYWSNDCFLVGEDRIRDRVGQLSGIPGVLIHGRHDISGPVVTPWLLHRSWAGSELHVVENEGHGGEEEMELAAAAISRFAMTE